MPDSPLYARALVGLVKGLVWVYDLITFPIYYFVQKPWLIRTLCDRKKAEFLKSGDPTSPLVRINYKDTVKVDFHTTDEMFRKLAHHSPSQAAFGKRQVLGEENVTMPNGKVFKKLNLGQYEWITYSEANRRVTNIAKGLRQMGIKSGQLLTIYAETRMEWMLTALACWRIKVPVVTIYATLGEEGVIHGLQETESEFVVTSVDLMPKVLKNLEKTPKVRSIIYMEGLKSPSLKGTPEHVQILSFNQLEKNGEDSGEDLAENLKPTKDDPAVIMYTSGSTGVPKGVLINQEQVVAAIQAFNDLGYDVVDAMYVAYLPLSHIYELVVEMSYMSLGIPIGYSSPLTLTAMSTAVKQGCPGDVDLLRPTHTTTVPLILDRIRKNIEENIAKRGQLVKAFFEFALEYKTSWYSSGYSTPLLDRILFRKTSRLVGGRCKVMGSGGAPISQETQEFTQAVLCLDLTQGYGMTETTSCGAITAMNDRTIGVVGPPVSIAKIKLIDWPEGNYYTMDKPNPRGEIVVGGPCVAMGYFKQPGLTAENFTGPDADGTRWFLTGDIGEVLPNGNLKIIDRKKDLVKLQFGEYISLGKVEAVLKCCALVENMCVIGNSYQSFLVALVSPNKNQLKKLAKELGQNPESPVQDLCSDSAISAAATKMIAEYGLKNRLSRTEVPTKYKLCSEEWLPDSGLVTAAYKIRRKIIEQFYQKDIEMLYSSSN